MRVAGLTRVAVYERSVPVALERVWENVLDWEHLPWLHASSFRSIDRLDAGDWGWRARVGLRGAGPGHEVTIELVREVARLRYVTRTLEGPGKGTEIWTRLDDSHPGRTGIDVGFHVPGAGPGRADALGAGYVALYTRLWDEDEAMMRRRAEELARVTPGGDAEPLDLGDRQALVARLPLCVEWGGRRFRVVEVRGTLLAHATVCPHRLGPLEDAPVEDGGVRCPWHGYRFDVASGRSADGRRLALPRPPRVVTDPATGRVRLEE